jgi:hypothetical protein
MIRYLTLMNVSTSSLDLKTFRLMDLNVQDR